MTGVIQCCSTLVSFVSIAFSSIKLFYTQRLGRFQDVDPSLKMVAFVALPIVILISGPLVAVICMASYFKDKVIVYIVINIVTNGCVLLLLPVLRRKLYPKFSNIYQRFESEEGENDVYLGEREIERTFFTAILTSWISPCTVWANSYRTKSYFLLVSSFTCLLLHTSGVAIIIYTAMYYPPSSFENPPITHCFERGIIMKNYAHFSRLI